VVFSWVSGFEGEVRFVGETGHDTDITATYCFNKSVAEFLAGEDGTFDDPNRIHSRILCPRVKGPWFGTQLIAVEDVVTFRQPILFQLRWTITK